MFTLHLNWHRSIILLRAPASTKQRGCFFNFLYFYFPVCENELNSCFQVWPWKKTKIEKTIQQATLYVQFEFFLPSSFFFFPAFTDLYKAILLLKSRCLFEVNLELLGNNDTGNSLRRSNFTVLIGFIR